MLYLTNTPADNLGSDVQKALQAADGYLYLGMPEEACAEVESLSAAEQTSSPVMRAQVRILLHLRKWRKAEELSEFGTAIYPLENEFLVQRAFALQQQKRANDAVEVLLAAPDWIRRTGILHYNLACYEAQLGDLRIARRCMNTAFEINAAFKKNARHDPDLQRLWN
jgi:tetratricopeptide (TPR) repeat protein